MYSSICLSLVFRFFFFKQKTAYEMRISDWSSDVCSSDLRIDYIHLAFQGSQQRSGFRVRPFVGVLDNRDPFDIGHRFDESRERRTVTAARHGSGEHIRVHRLGYLDQCRRHDHERHVIPRHFPLGGEYCGAACAAVNNEDMIKVDQFFYGRHRLGRIRSEEHTSELQSLMRISYAVFCWKKKNMII